MIVCIVIFHHASIPGIFDHHISIDMIRYFFSVLNIFPAYLLFLSNAVFVVSHSQWLSFDSNRMSSSSDSNRFANLLVAKINDK